MDDLDALIGGLDDKFKALPEDATKGGCAACHRNIIGPKISALNNDYHPECWKCQGCKKSLGEEEFFFHEELPGAPFCPACNEEKWAAKCFECGRAIVAEQIEALDQKYHPSCFVCFKCKKPFADGQFFPVNGKPHCDPCSD